MISLVRFIILSVFIIALSLCGFVASATADQTPVHTQVQKPVLIAELTVPRPTSIFSYCPDGTPLGTRISLSFLSTWSCIDISPDGQFLLTGDHLLSRDYESKVWQIENNNLVNTLVIDNFRAPTHFSPGGKYIFGVGTEIMGVTGRPRYGTAYAVWQASDGKLLRGGHWPRFTTSNTISPDESIYAVQGGNDLILLSFSDMKRIGHVGKVKEGSPVVFSPDSKLVAVSAKPDVSLFTVKSRSAYIWDIPNNKLHMHIAKKEKRLCEMFAFSDDSSKLATAYNNRFDVWDVNTGERLASINTDSGSGETRNLVFNSDSNKVIKIIQHWGDRASTIDLWDIKRQKLMMRYTEKAPKGKFSDSPDWKYMVRPWDAMVHPKLGIILIKYDSIYPRIIAAEEEAGSGDHFAAYQPSRKTPDTLKISIWRLEDMTRIFNSPE